MTGVRAGAGDTFVHSGAEFEHEAETLPVDNAVQHARRIEPGGPLNIEEFFQQSARDKRRLLLWSIPLFFAGIVAAAAAMLV